MADTTGNNLKNFDRSQLGAKTRVHALAKMLGVPSRKLVIELDRLGLVKVAQSTLSLSEANLLLDALTPSEEQPSTEAVEPSSKPADKDRKDAPKAKAGKGAKAKKAAPKSKASQPEHDEPAASDEPEPHDEETSEEQQKLRHRVEKNVANEIRQIERKVDQKLEDFAAAVEEEQQAELLEDVVPDITPVPADGPNFVTPIFMAPEGETPAKTTLSPPAEDASEDSVEDGARRKRRGRRGKGRGRGAVDTDVVVEEEPSPEPVAIKGSTRLEAQRRRRADRREENRKKRHIVSEAEFLARRESVERSMVVRERQRTDAAGLITQVGVVEDDLLVEHFVTSESQTTMVGNIYLGRVQNVLPSMEAAFIDIGKGRNGVLYAGEVDWRAAGLGGRARRIEQALKSGDQVLVQVTKDPVGHKGARLTTQISLAGRFLVYVPHGNSAGISRKLPEPERRRLKEILKEILPAQGSAIVRTAAEGVTEQEIAADVRRLHSMWEHISERTEEEKASKGAKPVTMYEEPDMLVKVVRDLFNEDFTRLIVQGERAWNTVHSYVQSVAPDLMPRLERYEVADHDGEDVFAHYRIDEQLAKALSRKVWLPSGGTLVIDRTEAMTVIDVNTGKFTGSGGNLEETVTRNNLEAAEEIVRQMRLRDLGGMVVVDFIDMVLPENQDLVLRRLTEALGRDRTRHQISEVTSLGLVQMTRKRLGTGLLETFSTECEHCGGRGIILHEDPVDGQEPRTTRRKFASTTRHVQPVGEHPAATAMHRAEGEEDKKPTIEELAAAVVIAEDDDVREHKQTYEEAVAAFEASPRRKRSTRGNSRSDRRPDPADFVDVDSAPESDSESVTEAVEEVIEKRRRGRRRAGTKRRNEIAQVREEDTAEEPRRRQASDAVAEHVEAVVETSIRRGRRRAVRRSQASAATSKRERVAEPEAQPAPASRVRSSRGRRRVVRKSYRSN
ncbi:translation initiation factor IF-2 N-terminal domain-containing protein [Corynebacterium sp.]|uniref:translation initiation factor IF-2 N-terminal domain-containing protein n=1 Tax=Corynebacterium sp. TaxID=1720 RepID=UPI0026DCBCC0|nr:translation initiation factor IF-2 N-terminal domain-containing protein [Corynebacterium sp.]MDO5076123.1 translation initiation factor IF-2 N-terminal domain-containing protein [Corynebacterium sp.]